MGICASSKRNDLVIKPKQWPASPGRRHTGNSFKYGTDLYINLKNGSIEQFYTIGEVIGVGAFGNVNLVTHKLRGTKRALKTLSKNKILNEEKEKMFAEVNVLRKLDHPNIVKLYELYEDSKNYYIITEFLAGGELVKRIKSQKTFTEQEAAKYIRQLLSALQYCHKASIVHRDLKLENLMLDSDAEDATLKVIDFGTSRRLLKDQYLTTLLGTPHYTAPEVFRGKYTEKCDIWSCGVIMYTLLCGYLPFNGQDARITQMLIEMGKWQFHEEDWATISNAAKSLIKKMLTNNHQKRITAEEAYNDPWIQGHVESHCDLNIIEKMKNISQNHIIQDLVFQYITANVLADEEKNKHFSHFQQLDKDGDGQLNKSDLVNRFTKASALESHLIGPHADSLLERFDTNKDGTVGYHQFLQMMTQQEIRQKQQLIEEAFHHFNTDNDGFVKKTNLEDVLGGIIIDEQHWEQVLEVCDKNKDGMLSQEEFLLMMQCNF